MNTGAQALADVYVRSCGTLWLFLPLSQTASVWLAENVLSESWQWLGNSLLVEWRFAGPLIDAARAAGLEVDI